MKKKKEPVFIQRSVVYTGPQERLQTEQRPGLPLDSTGPADVTRMSTGDKDPKRCNVAILEFPLTPTKLHSTKGCEDCPSAHSALRLS